MDTGREKMKRIISLFLLLLLFACSTVSVKKTQETEPAQSQKPAHSYVKEGIAYYDSSLYDKALQVWQQALKEDSANAELHNFIGMAYQHKGDVNQAINYFSQAIKLKPDYYQAHNNLGYMYFLQNDYENANKEYDKALAIKPDFAQAKNNKELLKTVKSGKISKQAFDIVEKAGKEWDYAKQIELYRQALLLNPDYAKAHNNIAVAFYYEDEQDSAYAHLNEAIRLNSDYQEALNNLGYLYKNDGDYGLAQIYFLRALTINPNYLSALDNLGETYLLAGQLENAEKTFKKVLEVYPGDERAEIGLQEIKEKRQGKSN
jgi:tetratricopeptide (TPR) repeat protein